MELSNHGEHTEEQSRLIDAFEEPFVSYDKKLDLWREEANKQVIACKREFMRDYHGKTGHYHFTINHLEAFGYRTIPVIIDYRLFVDIVRSDGEEEKSFPNILLGAYFDSKPRKSIPFGEAFFNETHHALIEIVASIYEKIFNVKRQSERERRRLWDKEL